MSTILKVVVDDGMTGGLSSQLRTKTWVAALRGCTFQEITRDGVLIAEATVLADNIILTPEEEKPDCVHPRSEVIDSAVEQVTFACLDQSEAERKVLEGELRAAALKLKRMIEKTTGGRGHGVATYIEHVASGDSALARVELKNILRKAAAKHVADTIAKSVIQERDEQDED